MPQEKEKGLTLREDIAQVRPEGHEKQSHSSMSRKSILGSWFYGGTGHAIVLWLPVIVGRH